MSRTIDPGGASTDESDGAAALAIDERPQPAAAADEGPASRGPESEPVPDAEAAPKRSVWRRLWRLIRGRRPVRRLLLVVLLVFVSVGVFAAMAWNRVGRFDWKATGSAPGGTTYLLVGSDSREFVTTADDRRRYGGTDRTPGERADVLFALRLDDDGGERLLSIPRDLLVMEEGRGLVRVAETLENGPSQLSQALCRSIGLGVDHVVVMHLDGLRGMVNAVGGIDVVLDTNVRDLHSGLGLPAGRVHLDGDQVLAYVGSRRLQHLEADGTWRARPEDTNDRPGRAASVLGTLGDEVKKSWYSPIAATGLVWAAADGTDLDQGFGLGDAWALRGAIASIGSTARIELPVTTTGTRLRVDNVAPGAGAQLDEFEGGDDRGERCTTPAFPAAARK